jgi:hypothetical protein
MKPKATANRILSTTRARAKMHEFRVAPEDFIQLYRDPSMLFDLAVGILGDVASVSATDFRGAEAVAAFDPDLIPTSWVGVDLTVTEGLRFASTFFDAYLNARLDETISVEFSLLCASAYYLNGSIGNASVIVKRMEVPSPELAGGLGLLTYHLLKNERCSNINGRIYGFRVWGRPGLRRDRSASHRRISERFPERTTVRRFGDSDLRSEAAQCLSIHSPRCIRP